MTEPRTAADESGDRLYEAIALFEEARDMGLDPDPQEWLRRYPEVAGRLADFFAARKSLKEFAAPLMPAGAVADTAPDIPDYQILEEVGPGGMGVVYKARHLFLDKVVALKVLRPERMRDPEAVARFRREMRAVGGLQHANIVAAQHAGEAGGRHYLVMEFVEGMSLNEVVRRRGPLPVADACEVARQAALGLQHAHEHGLVHRDVKPGNLRLTPAGQVKVLDLGLAAFRCEDLALRTELTASGSFLGTADYTAPEQWADPRAADIRADLYSLGCTLYCLLAGRPPFGDAAHDTWHKKMKAHEQAPVPPIREGRPEVPEGLAAVLDRLLAKRPGERFGTPVEVARALEPSCAGSNPGGLVRDGRGPGVPARSDPRPTAPRPRRRWLLPLLGAVAAVLAVAALSWWQYGPYATETGQTATEPGPSAAAPVKASLSLQVSGPNNSLRQGLLLYQPGALPLRTGDSIQVTVRLSRPAYPYLVWLDSQGRATPLYPWQDDDWHKRPMSEARRDRLVWQGDDLRDTPTGIESLLLLVRESPLPAGADVAGLFTGLAAQPEAVPSAVAAWFENGELVRDDSYRGPPQVGKRRTVLDPVLQTQDLLRGRLQALFPSTRAVCFSFEGHARGG
jgi:serine/threonine protein kinase